MPYVALNAMIDPAFPKGARNYWKAQFLSDLSDNAIRALIERNLPTLEERLELLAWVVWPTED